MLGGGGGGGGLFGGLCDCFCGVFLYHNFSEMVYFFNYFCIVVSVSCFLFVWSLADSLYPAAVSVWWLFSVSQHWTWTRGNTIRRDEGCLVYNGIHSVVMGPCTALSDYIRWEFTQVSNSTRLSGSSNARDLPERTRKMQNIGTALNDKVFVRFFEFCAVFLHSELKMFFIYI